MKWKSRRRSSNVEDRRGKNRLGGVSSVLLGGSGIGTLVLLFLFTFLGGDGSELMNSINTEDQTTDTVYQSSAEEDELFDYVSVILADTEDIWTDIFDEYGYDYVPPKLVVYNDRIQSACDVSGSSTGPFYCPADERLYIDLSFYDELRYQFEAPGDFAMAYVVAHEVGHHVQNQLGLEEQFRKMQQNSSQEQTNAMLV